MRENQVSPLNVGSDDRNGVYTISANDFNGTKSAARRSLPTPRVHDVERANSFQSPVGGKDVTHPTSYVETLIHILKANIGSGLFAMGDAFKNSGLVAGPICTLFIGFICIYSQHELLGASGEAAKRLKLSYAPDYPETVELSFKLGPNFIRKRAAFGKFLCNMFLCITQIGFCSVYFVFVSTNLKEVMDTFGVNLNAHLWMLVILPPILLLSWVRNLKHLTPASLLSNVLIATGISLTVYMCIDGSNESLPPLDSRPAVANWKQFPLFFGTTVYCFEAISLIIPLRNEMKNPEKFSSPLGVLNIGVGITCLILVGMGFISFLRFGDDIKGSVTLNMDSSLILTKVLQLSIVVAIIFTYPIQAYVPIQLIWPPIWAKYSPMKHPDFVELLVRSLLVIFTYISKVVYGTIFTDTVLLAETVPRLELFISLVGAVSSSTLAIIFPPLINILVYWDNQRSTMHVLGNVAIIIFGVLGCIVGTYTSLDAIIRAFIRGEMNIT